MNVLVKDAQDGASSQEAMKKTKEEIHGCGLGGYAGTWFERCSRGQGKMKENNLLG